MSLKEFIKNFPITSEIFRTENCSPNQIITTMMSRYSEENPGSGRNREYTIETIRELVVYRLVAMALDDFSGGTNAGVSSDHTYTVKMQTRHFMPESVRFTMVGYTLTIYIPPRIRKELNQKREGNGGNV